jgi:glycosyltransferase involved in cell wall biosynthesis
VIAVSDFARREVIDGYRLDADQVVTVHNGIDARFLEAGPKTAPAPGAAPAMLFPGAPVGHKNLASVLGVMAAADPRSALGQARLDISGARGEDFPEHSAAIASLGLGDRVRWLGQVTAEAMPTLIAQAALVIYPSLYEGFGLPPLEAMAVGTPVVASDRGPLPEMLGDAALLVDPSDLSEMARALDAVLSSPDLRVRLAVAGRKRARLYTWAKCAERTVDVYRAALAASSHRR